MNKFEHVPFEPPAEESKEELKQEIVAEGGVEAQVETEQVTLEANIGELQESLQELDTTELKESLSLRIRDKLESIREYLGKDENAVPLALGTGAAFGSPLAVAGTGLIASTGGAAALAAVTGAAAWGAVKLGFKGAKKLEGLLGIDKISADDKESNERKET